MLFGSFTAVLILFSVPVTLLGTISPFAIRLAISDPRHAGRDLGSDLRHLHSGLIRRALSARAGLDSSDRYGATPFLAFRPVPAAGALVGLWLSAAGAVLRSRLDAAGAGSGGGNVSGRAPIKTTTGQIYETESAYNYIQVLERDGYRFLQAQ